MTKSRHEEMRDLARQAAKDAYCPYSCFHVGACVDASDSSIHVGCNVENASYGLTICAERNALFNMVADGHRKFRRLVVVCPDAKEDDPKGYHMPCGACRQVMAEFADEGAIIEVVGVGEFTMSDLLPDAFKL